MVLMWGGRYLIMELLLSKQITWGEFVTENNVLSYVSTQEGRLRFAGGNATYEYFIKDHLGNVRVSFENQEA